MAKNNNTLAYRVGQVEIKVNEIDKNVSAILENHLPHLETQVVANKTRIAVTTAINIGAIITGILISKAL